ncbi:universal stress protein in QAH/OAS sulfhydrylase 3'region-like isoform X4 [Saccostrea cucullata]|uniref:universal stress protein in QAH/OAS sulfhydrylase 3'region-like isoform X4 n=2 Tax=Saccostrea cuccullata TaxID=36930 RepID=UPI002ED2BBFE
MRYPKLLDLFELCIICLHCDLVSVQYHDPHRELLEEVRHKVEALEAKYNKKIEKMGIKSAKFLKRHGDPGEAIVHVAEKEHANLIVTGCRGMGLLRRTFMGSVSDYVMHHASCPVLVCRK